MEADWAKAGSGTKQEPVEVDPDAKARLAALGYVGSFVRSNVDETDRTGLADPKDKIDLFNKFSQAWRRSTWPTPIAAWGWMMRRWSGIGAFCRWIPTTRRASIPWRRS